MLYQCRAVFTGPVAYFEHWARRDSLAELPFGFWCNTLSELWQKKKDVNPSETQLLVRDHFMIL